MMMFKCGGGPRCFQAMTPRGRAGEGSQAMTPRHNGREGSRSSQVMSPRGREGSQAMTPRGREGSGQTPREHHHRSS
eukprot:365522-Rhodomonas_salina.1